MIIWDRCAICDRIIPAGELCYGIKNWRGDPEGGRTICKNCIAPENAPTLTLPSEWVSAEDDPPKLTGKYICCVEDIHGHMWSISADYLFEMKTWVGEFGEIKNKVVFWMPLPNPPNV